MSFSFRRASGRPLAGPDIRNSDDDPPNVLRGQVFIDHVADQRSRFHGSRNQIEQSQQCSGPVYQQRIRQCAFPFLEKGSNQLQNHHHHSFPASQYGHHSTPWAETMPDKVVATYSLTSDERLVSCRWSPDGQDLCVLGQDKLHFLNGSAYTFHPRTRPSEAEAEGEGAKKPKRSRPPTEEFLRKKMLADLGVYQGEEVEGLEEDEIPSVPKGPGNEAVGQGERDSRDEIREEEDEEEGDNEEDEEEEEEEEDDDDNASIALIQMLFGGAGGISREAARQLALQMQIRTANGVSPQGRGQSTTGSGVGGRSTLSAFRQRQAQQQTSQDLRSEHQRREGVLDGVFHIHNVGWSLLDCAWSTDSRICAVGGWSSTVHLYRASEEYPAANGGYSNWTVRPRRRTVAIDVSGEGDDEDSYYSGRGPGVFSMTFMGGDNSRIACGTNENVAVVVDVETDQLLSRHRHMNDVNTVAAFDSNIFVSGSDDHTIKVHDTRLNSSGGSTVTAGFLLGHASGLASVDCHSDGYHLVSAGKDQCCKLWDIRKMTSGSTSAEADRLHELCMRMPSSDYRRGTAPPPTCSSKDQSVLTFQGEHYTLVTLCRARISPTGRYVACASAENAVGVYDILTGEGKKISSHTSVCRDVSWHPTLPLLSSASWDGSVKFYSPKEYDPLHETKEALSKGAQFPGGGDDGMYDEEEEALMGLSPADFYDALDSEEDEDEFY